jgi:hypothetical protein
MPGNDKEEARNFCCTKFEKYNLHESQREGTLQDKYHITKDVPRRFIKRTRLVAVWQPMLVTPCNQQVPVKLKKTS